MKRFLSVFGALLVAAVLWSAFVPQQALAKAHIMFHTKQVYLSSPGKAKITGYFENDGDTGAYVKWMQFGLTLNKADGQLLWQDYGIRHNMDVYVPAHGKKNYSFFVKNKDIPEYHQRFKWKIHNKRVHWNTSAG